ncbi:hypothetical protein NEAUS06_2143 [Nematocida ausubeli]|nr:hypothetical protein NEAUS06_2143 [Nematocida ausubeli]
MKIWLSRVIPGYIGFGVISGYIGLSFYFSLFYNVNASYVAPLYYPQTKEVQEFLECVYAKGAYSGDEGDRLENIFNASSIEIDLVSLPGEIKFSLLPFRNWQKICITGSKHEKTVNILDLTTNDLIMKKLESILVNLERNMNILEIELKNMHMSYIPLSLENIPSLSALKFHNISYAWNADLSKPGITKTRTRSINIFTAIRYIQPLQYLSFHSCNIAVYDDTSGYTGLNRAISGYFGLFRVISGYTGLQPDNLKTAKFTDTDIHFINEFLWYYNITERNNKIHLIINNPTRYNKNAFLDLEEVYTSVDELSLYNFNMLFVNSGYLGVYQAISGSGLNRVFKAFRLINSDEIEEIHTDSYEEINGTMAFWSEILESANEVEISIYSLPAIKDIMHTTMPKLIIVDLSQQTRVQIISESISMVYMELSVNLPESTLFLIFENNFINGFINRCTSISIYIQEYYGNISGIFKVIMGIYTGELITVQFMEESFVYMEYIRDIPDIQIILKNLQSDYFQVKSGYLGLNRVMPSLTVSGNSVKIGFSKELDKEEGDEGALQEEEGDDEFFTDEAESNYV